MNMHVLSTHVCMLCTCVCVVYLSSIFRSASTKMPPLIYARQFRRGAPSRCAPCMVRVCPCAMHRSLRVFTRDQVDEDDDVGGVFAHECDVSV